MKATLATSFALAAALAVTLPAMAASVHFSNYNPNTEGFFSTAAGGPCRKDNDANGVLSLGDGLFAFRLHQTIGGRGLILGSFADGMTVLHQNVKGTVDVIISFVDANGDGDVSDPGDHIFVEGEIDADGNLQKFLGTLASPNSACRTLGNVAGSGLFGPTTRFLTGVVSDRVGVHRAAAPQLEAALLNPAKPGANYQLMPSGFSATGNCISTAGSPQSATGCNTIFTAHIVA